MSASETSASERHASERHAIEARFAHDFEPWGLALPPGAVEARTPGRIEAEGWHVRYVWGTDEQGDYLDYLASHRMTNQRHVRIRTTGEIEWLPSAHDFFVYNEDEGSEDEAREAYVAHNRRVGEMLKRKGLAD